MRLRAAAAIAATMVLAGCGSGGSEEPEAAPSSSSPEPATLQETCPEVEEALDGGPENLREVEQFGDRLVELAEAGDTETQNALDLLGPAVVQLRDAFANDATGMPLLEARDAFRTGLDDFARRCAAAGSSALQ